MWKTQSLTEEILRVVRDQGTDLPHTGPLTHQNEGGSYLCRQCGIALFRSYTKFDSFCGWPSFDEEILGTILRKPDPDQIRTEIVCARCHAHLGHVFLGEDFTAKNIRYCVNSSSLDFAHSQTVKDSEEGIFAGGCFWGVEHLFKKLPGVVLTEVGYIGGHTDNPSYQQVCTKTTGHTEAVRVVFDKNITSYTDVAHYFFEIHDPTQKNGQGPDIGPQYESKIFYYDDGQKQIASQLIETLKTKGYSVATQILPMSIFWPAEDYHQAYYQKSQENPYCHHHVKRFYSAFHKDPNR